MKLSQFLIPLAMVICGLAIYDLVCGQPEDRAQPTAGDPGSTSENSGSVLPSFEPKAPPRSRTFDDARVTKLEQVIATFRAELANTRADLLALEVSRGRELRPRVTDSPGPIGNEDVGASSPDFSTLELDRYEALVVASRRRAETRNFAKAIAARLPKLPIDLTKAQQRQLLDLTLEFRARSSAVASDAEREGLRRDMDRQLGDIVQGRDAQIVSDLLVEAAVPPPLPGAGSDNTGNR